MNITIEELVSGGVLWIAIIAIFAVLWTDGNGAAKPNGGWNRAKFSTWQMVGAACPRRHRHRLDDDRRVGCLAIRPTIAIERKSSGRGGTDHDTNSRQAFHLGHDLFDGERQEAPPPASLNAAVPADRRLGRCRSAGLQIKRSERKPTFACRFPPRVVLLPWLDMGQQGKV
jgi:hypothetical protein